MCEERMKYHGKNGRQGILARTFSPDPAKLLLVIGFDSFMREKKESRKTFRDRQADRDRQTDRQRQRLGKPEASRGA